MIETLKIRFNNFIHKLECENKQLKLKILNTPNAALIDLESPLF